MVADRRDVRPRFGPSKRILELAQHKTSKTVWATTPCDRLVRGNQDPVWPISEAALAAVPSPRIQYLAQHKRDFSARESPSKRTEDKEANVFRKRRPPSAKTFQYESIVRLSTPRGRRCSLQEVGPPHTPQCEILCPIWHINPRVRTAVIGPRLLQLSQPKGNHPDYQSDRQSIMSPVSVSSGEVQASHRLLQLSLPRLKQGNICIKMGRPEESIWAVSKAARRATASARVEKLATPKQLPEEYVPPREPEWSQTT